MSEMDQAFTEAVNVLGEAEVADAPRSIPGSLEDRVAQRHKKVAAATTETFDVPNYEGIFKVELQYIGGKRQHAIAKSHEHVRDEYQQTVRVASDLILAATVGFYSVVNDDGDTKPAEGCTWKRLAAAVDPTLSVDTVKGRVSIIRVLTEDGVIVLAGRYRQWMNNRGEKVDAEVRDF